MQKNFWMVLIGVIVLMVGVFLATGGKDEQGSLADYNPEVVQLSDHIYGLDELPTTQEDLDQVMAEKKAVLIEYGDFQCSACRDFFPVFNEIKNTYADDVVVVYRHFPLTSIHPNAMAAHRAVVAADKQGAFWDMHDLMFLRQQSWQGVQNPASLFEGYAQELELDLEQFRTDVSASETFDRINVDISSARPWGVNSTPTIFFNGEKVPLPALEALTDLIDTALTE